jgi:hypothetical protein
MAWGGMREGPPGGHGGDLHGAPFGTAVGLASGVVSDGDLPRGQGGELSAQAGLVALDGDQVMCAALAGQVLGVAVLGVQGIGGDHRSGQVDGVQQRGEHRDLVRLGLDIGLPQDHALRVIEGGQKVTPGTSGHA